MNRRGALLFAAMCVIWGIPYLMIRVAVRELAPVTLVFFRTAIGALLLTPVAGYLEDEVEYAQADDGSVWYLGEDVFDYRKGAVAITEKSRNPSSDIASVRGIGVAVSVSTSTSARRRFSCSFCRTPKRCSSSMMTSPRRWNLTSA